MPATTKSLEYFKAFFASLLIVSGILLFGSLLVWGLSAPLFGHVVTLHHLSP